MNSSFILIINRRIDQLLSYPGIDAYTLQLKRNVWVGDLGSWMATVGMTVLGWFLGIPIIVYYGIALFFVCMPAIVAVPFMRKNFDRIGFTFQMAAIWVTFYFMIRMGGLLNSAGLIFSGISILSLSINYQNHRMTVWLFIAYLLSLFITALLQPRLVPAPELTPGKNLLFFVVNFSWQAAMILMLILTNINQKKKISEAEKAEAGRLKDLDEFKTRFFTNITHEFRTPLTIILGMAKLAREQPGQWLEEGTEKISSNGRYLLNLVNQMLDLSKLESGALPLHIYQQDIIFQLKYLVDSFHSLAQDRQTDLQFEADAGSHFMDYDAEKLVHIVTNLVSNAVKYTQRGGRVVLSTKLVENDGPFRIIEVSDNGPGIPAGHLEHIFERFYRIEESTITPENGTGLGLALTKELVKLMNGTLDVRSNPGEGTTFTVSFPVTKKAPLKETGIPIKVEGAMQIQASSGKKTESHQNLTDSDHDKPIILIVEDNSDLITYLAAILRHDYHIEVAPNGRIGLTKAFEFIPDIILSDVMMPEMDGITLLEKIKSDQRSSHIPMVMLTAKADIESRLEGLERGADAYLAKPFNEDELHIVLKNLIEIRRLLYKRYATMEILPKTEDRAVQIEDAFIMKVQKIMEANLSEETFGILELCREIGMSRAQLYRKFKTLTDKTVNDYLRDFRLFQAKKLLELPDLNVSEVAYQVGFKNLSHFSRVFTETYGINPSEYHKKRIASA